MVVYIGGGVGPDRHRHRRRCRHVLLLWLLLRLHLLQVHQGHTLLLLRRRLTATSDVTFPW